MKRRKEEEGGGQEWLNTYADMITLVLTFFVLLYSISNVKITKLEQIAAAMQKKLGMEQAVSLDEVPEDIKYPTIGEETGGVPDSTSTESIQKMAEELREYFANSNIDAQTSSSDDVIYIRFKNDLLFGPDSAQLREESVSMLDSLGNMLMEKEDEILAVYINGHTAQAAGSPVNDRVLSSMRADNVAIYLEDHVGFDPKKLICRGYGKYYPIADNSTKEGRELNRRVDIIILGNDFKMSDVDERQQEVIDPLAPVTLPELEKGQDK